MAQSDTDYYYGHGEVWLGDRAADGTVATFENFPEIDELAFTLTSESISHMSKRGSIRVKDLDVVVGTGGTGKMVTSVFTATALKTYLFGSSATVGAGTFTDVSVGTPSVGDWVKIPGDYRDVTVTAVTDSDGTPVTLTPNTHYIVDSAAGMIKFLSLTGPFVGPYLVTGTAGAGTGVGLLQTRKFEKYLRFKGINIADGDNSVTVDLYKVQIKPSKDFQLLGSGNEPNKFEIEFEILKDTTKSTTATFGQLGDMKILT